MTAKLIEVIKNFDPEAWSLYVKQEVFATARPQALHTAKMVKPAAETYNKTPLVTT